MARTNGNPTTHLKTDLLNHGNRYSFFQAMRLLDLLIRLEKNNRPKSRAKEKDPTVVVSPELALHHPGTDITAIKEREGEPGYSVTSTFMGLYGVSSPLPNFYTEDLIQDRREGSEPARAFLDILNRRIYQLLNDCWKKYRMNMQIAESQSPNHIELLEAICGIEGASFYNGGQLDPILRYAGMFGSHPRSALGLETILSDFLDGAPVEIISCVPRDVKIPEDQRLQLGEGESALGVDTLIGEEMVDYQSKFRVKIGPVPQKEFCSILHGGETNKELTKVIDRYLNDPLEFDFEVILKEGQAKHPVLGGNEWSRLGLDTVLFTGELKGTMAVTFPSGN